MEATPVSLASLPEGSYFEMPWRKKYKFGEFIYGSETSCYVSVGHGETGVLEKTNFSPASPVLPATKEQYLADRSGNEDGKPRERSEVESPVKLVHRLCNEMEGAERKDVIAACVEAGVNPSTAKTQYYHWKKTQ